nr:MAG TPA: hypothetical protein [Caudoviricetes sp.]
MAFLFYKPLNYKQIFSRPSTTWAVFYWKNLCD